MMRRSLLVLVLATAACTEPTRPEAAPVGQLSATLAGASLSEQYEAQGRYLDPTDAPVTFAAARRAFRGDALSVGGWRARSGMQDALLLDLRGVDEPGVYPTTGGVFIYGSSDSEPGRIFRIAAGEVHISAASGDRLQGTFRATAIEMVPPVVGPSPDTLHILGGTFDIPVVIP
jgi:hypothetical protein